MPEQGWGAVRHEGGTSPGLAAVGYLGEVKVPLALVYVHWPDTGRFMRGWPFRGVRLVDRRPGRKGERRLTCHWVG